MSVATFLARRIVDGPSRAGTTAQAFNQQQEETASITSFSHEACQCHFPGASHEGCGDGWARFRRKAECRTRIAVVWFTVMFWLNHICFAILGNMVCNLLVNERCFLLRSTSSSRARRTRRKGSTSSSRARRARRKGSTSSSRARRARRKRSTSRSRSNLRQY
jgi:hypothetical protein